MHTSTASFMILQHVVEYSIGCQRCASIMCARTARVCVQAEPSAARAVQRVGTPYCTRVARGAGTRFSTLEHASSVLGSGKRGQTGDPGIMTPRRGRGSSGAWGADFVKGRGARAQQKGRGRRGVVEPGGFEAGKDQSRVFLDTSHDETLTILTE